MPLISPWRGGDFLRNRRYLASSPSGRVRIYSPNGEVHLGKEGTIMMVLTQNAMGFVVILTLDFAIVTFVPRCSPFRVALSRVSL